MNVGDLVIWKSPIPDLSDSGGFRWSQRVGIVLCVIPFSNGDSRLKILSSDRKIARRYASAVEVYNENR